MSEIVAARPIDIESLDLSFDLPASFSVESDPDFVFVARSTEPPAILTIEDASARVLNHTPQGGESLDRVDVGAVEATVVQDAVVEGLLPGVAARELLVSNGVQSFSAIMSAPEQDLPQLWDQLIGTVAVGGVIGDEAFVEDANRVCETAFEQRPEPASADASMAQRADAVQKEVSVVEGMVHRLRELPVAAEDQEEVGEWLDHWEEYVAVGHRYADAIRTESPDYADIGNEADEPASYINTFARNNGLDACVA